MENTGQALKAHLEDCAAQRRRLAIRLKALEDAVDRLRTGIRWQIWVPFAGSALVAVAIVLD